MIDLQAGQLIARRYALEEALGQGAQGVVWRATDTLRQQTVALKFMRQDSPSQDRWREATLLRKLNSPHVAPLLDEGLYHSMAYLVTPWIQGSPFPGQDALEPAQWVARARQLLKQLATLHAQGLIHGDLKPEHVLVTPRGDLVLLDLGLAQRQALDDPEGLRWGSPRYMAPEQLRGEPLTGACDLYAVGVMLFERACGRAPHPGQTLRELMRQRLLDPAPEPKPLPEGAPQALRDLIAALMSPEPKDRLAALDEPGQAQRPGPLSLPWLDAHRAARSALAALLRQRRSAWIVGQPGVGGRQLMQQALAQAGLEARWVGGDGQPITLEAIAQALGWSPDSLQAHQADSLEALHEALAASARALADRAALALEHAQTERPDDQALLERLRSSMVVLTRSPRGQSAAAHDELRLYPLSPQAIEALFEGTRVGERVSPRAANALWQRTGGLVGRLARELAAWREAGLATLTANARWRVDPEALELLERDALAPQEAPTGDQPLQGLSPLAHQLLLALTMCRGALTLTQLGGALQAPRWRVERELMTLLDRQLVSLQEDAQTVVALWRDELALTRQISPQQELALGQRLAAQLPLTSREQRALFERTTSPDELGPRALALAQRLDQQGRLDAATHLLRLAMERLHHAPEHAQTRAELARRWAKIALSTHSPGPIEAALAACRTHEQASQELGPLISLLETARLCCRAPDHETLAALEALEPFEDPTLELRRHMYRAFVCFRLPDASLDDALEQASAWVRDSRDQEAQATLTGWRGWRAYHQGDYALAAQLHMQAAADKQRLSGKLASELAAIAALLDALEPERALKLAQRALERALELEHAHYQVEAAHFIQLARYRAGELEQPQARAEHIEAAEQLGLKRLHALLIFNDAAHLWRTHGLDHARARFERAAELVHEPALRDLARVMLGHDVQGSPWGTLGLQRLILSGQPPDATMLRLAHHILHHSSPHHRMELCSIQELRTYLNEHAPPARAE